MFKPPSEGISAIGGRAITAAGGDKYNADREAAADSGAPAPGAYSMSPKPKRKGSAPTFLGASALPPSGSIQSGGGKTLLGQ